MKRFKTIIIDDEEDNIDLLTLLLKRLPQIEVSKTFTSALAALDEIDGIDPHIVFLDIQMPDMTGLEFLSRIETRKFYTIFTTGYDQYAIEAIKLDAADYLLKPIQFDDLENAVNKLNPVGLISDPKTKHISKLISEPEVTSSNRLIVSSQQGFRSIDFNDIVYLEAQQGNYCIFFLKNEQRIISTKSLNYYENTIDSEVFFRIHRKHMVNIKHVKGFDSQSGIVTLSNKAELIISTRKRSDFRKMFRK